MKNKAFTLVEILVIITVLSILALSFGSFNFNKSRDREEVELLKNSIVSKFSTVRNNSMMGKGIGTNLDYPKLWKITFSTGSNIMSTEYKTGATFVTDNENTIIDTTRSISKISCLKIDGSSISGLGNISSGVVLIEGDQLSLSGGCNDPLARKLQMNFKYNNEISTGIINVVNGLVE